MNRIFMENKGREFSCQLKGKWNSDKDKWNEHNQLSYSSMLKGKLRFFIRLISQNE